MREIVGRARLLLVAGLLVGTTACGSGSSDGNGSSIATGPSDAVAEQEASSSSPTPIAVADAIIARHGPVAGFAATLYALDAGYSTDQLTTAALNGMLDADGSITGVEPIGPDHGLIAAPVESIRRSGETPPSTAEDVYRQIDHKLTTLATIRLLGAPLGVADDISYEDVFPSEPELSEAAKDAAAAQIGVLVSLIDVGYTFDQVVNGFVFGEIQAAIGVDRSRETGTGWSLDGGAVAACFTLRDSTGGVIVPDGQGANRLLMSATCGRAIRAGTISFDGLDGLRRDAAENGSDDTTRATEPVENGEEDPAATHALSATFTDTEEDGEVDYQWSATFEVADDGTISGGGTVAGRSAGTCDVAEIDSTFGEYSTSGEGSFGLIGQVVGANLEIEFVNPTGQLTTREGDESQLCVDVSFDVAEALLLLRFGAPQLGGPIVVPESGGSVSLEPPDWGIAIDVEVARL